MIHPYKAWDPEDMAVRLHADCGVLRYRATIETLVRRGRYWHIDLYEVREGRWQVVWSQATEIE